MARGGVPSTALEGGVDIDGQKIYVGRAFHEGDWLPAKVIPGRNCAYVCFNGSEVSVERFQVSLNYFMILKTIFLQSTINKTVSSKKVRKMNS